MKLKLLGLLSVAALASTSAGALEFACRGTQQVFSSAQERRAAQGEDDPVVRISVSVWDAEGGPHMTVGHLTRSGRVFDRSEQYPASVVERTAHGYRWRGVYDRDARVTMIGTLRMDRSDVYYTETRYRGGEAQWQIRADCDLTGGGGQ